MSDRFFLDTNILIYTFDESQPEKCRIAEDLVGRALAGEGCISSQVVQETLQVLTRKIAQPLTFSQARLYFYKALRPLCQLGISQDMEILHDALSIQEHYRYGFYDSLIIAAALKLNCGILYSEDLQHRQKVEGMKIMNPFREGA